MVLIRPFATFFVAAAVCTAILKSSVVEAAQNTAIDGFRSELWTMEYRRKEKSDEDPESGDPHDQLPDVDIAEQKTKPGTPNASSNGIRIDDVPVPGEIALPELEAQTPLVEWQVDAGALAPVGSDHDEPSAWELSQASGFRTEASVDSSDGPTATTFAVAIVACIVVTGALFSGRD